MRNFSFLAFVVLTFCCWGVYGPVLHIGQELMGEGPKKLSSLRPFICVGVAYFLIAVVYPIVMLKTTGEKGSWSISGFIWSFAAGAIGAIGALGIILAFKFQGKPVYVMPLVFGLAPIVNTFVTMIMAGTIREASPRFYLGILLVAIGAAGVLTFKPTKPKADPAPAVTLQHAAETSQMTLVSLISRQDPKPDAAPPVTEPQENAPSGQQTQPETEPPAKQPATPPPGNSKLKDAMVNVDEQDPQQAPAAQPNQGQAGQPLIAADQPEAAVLGPDAPAPPEKLADTATKPDEPNLWLIAACIAITAFSWGAYGPVLHKGQSRMAGSRLRPFLCVGLAYFAIAVLVPLFLLERFEEPGGWNLIGSSWSMLAGIAGAVGALGIIYAFNFGGKPIFVMPLVFGFAPVVNTLFETLTKNLIDQVSVYFLASLATVIVGAVMVLVFTPKSHPPQPANEPALE